MQHEPSSFAAAEAWVGAAVEWLRLIVEAVGAGVVALGLVAAAVELARGVARHRGGAKVHRHVYGALRLTLARYLALALELQLAADILSTAIAPSWDRIGQLAAIAVVRTALNYFLGKEIAAERREIAERGAAGERAEQAP